MNIKEIIGKMTLEEKISFLCGSSAGSMLTEGCERLGVKAQVLTDDPLGVRPDLDSVAFPRETSMQLRGTKSLLNR